MSPFQNLPGDPSTDNYKSTCVTLPASSTFNTPTEDMEDDMSSNNSVLPLLPCISVPWSMVSPASQTDCWLSYSHWRCNCSPPCPACKPCSVQPSFWLLPSLHSSAESRVFDFYRPCTRRRIHSISELFPFRLLHSPHCFSVCFRGTPTPCLSIPIIATAVRFNLRPSLPSSHPFIEPISWIATSLYLVIAHPLQGFYGVVRQQHGSWLFCRWVTILREGSRQSDRLSMRPMMVEFPTFRLDDPQSTGGQSLRRFQREAGLITCWTWQGPHRLICATCSLYTKSDSNI